ncbi:MAG: hypothetical protein NC203_08110 [Firmicutes bacterium]|nr:hypothetical protein [[Eubacterium] siraeum]MCM1488313.1 hypothetical protein [Bacillota bacterium]
MSQRELALQMVNNLSEEKAAALIVFLREFAGAEAEELAKQREIERKRKAFARMNELTRPLDIGDNDKEILQKHREEKYGS